VCKESNKLLLFFLRNIEKQSQSVHLSNTQNIIMGNTKSNSNFVQMNDMKNGKIIPDKNVKKAEFKKLLEAITNRRQICTNKDRQQILKYAQEYMPYGIFDEQYQLYYILPGNNNLVKAQNYLFYTIASTDIKEATDVLLRYINSDYYNPSHRNTVSHGSYLISAMYYKNKEVVDAIMKRDDYLPDVVNNFNDTALTYACYNNWPDVALKLLEKEAYQDPKLIMLINKHQHTALTYACKYRMLDVIKIITNRTKATMTDAQRQLLLRDIISNKMFDILDDELILEILTVQLPYGKTLLTLVREDNNKELFEKLLILAMKNIPDPVAFCEFITSDQNTTLTSVCYAAKNNLTDFVDHAIDMIKKAYQTLTLDRKWYSDITLKILENAVILNDLKYIEKLVSTFAYDQKDILTIWNRSNKPVRNILIKYFDINDTAFIIEKYGINKITVNISNHGHQEPHADH
jgi:hypothetical protein